MRDYACKHDRWVEACPTCTPDYHTCDFEFDKCRACNNRYNYSKGAVYVTRDKKKKRESLVDRLTYFSHQYMEASERLAKLVKSGKEKDIETAKEEADRLATLSDSVKTACENLKKVL